MLNILLNLDSQITQFINSFLPHTPFLNLFFSFFSLRGNSILIWLVIILLLVIFEEKHNHKFIIYFLIIIAAVYITNDLFLKNLFHRPRPVLTDFNRFQLIQPILTNCPSDFSFPSGHAATAFAAAAILSFFDKKRRIGYYLIAFLITLSRVYLFCHFFFDVVTGGLIGWLTAKIILIGQKTHSIK